MGGVVVPKIIENVREQLLEEAKRQIRENGYSKTTIRSVAGACRLGVGTVYNYFESKDMLIASFMLEDWMECLGEMQKASTSEPEQFVAHFYEALQGFIQKHQYLFQDADAAKSFAGAFTVRHKQLIDQLASLLQPICENAEGDKAFLAEFIAEALLTWVVAGRPIEDVMPLILKLLKP